MNVIQGLFNNLFSFGTYVMWFLVVMIPLVVIHEFGHFIFAKLFKVDVPEFGVGVPPRAKGKIWKNMLWSLNWLPFGAFVRIAGDNDSYEKFFHLTNNEPNINHSKAFIQDRREEIFALGDLELYLVRRGVKYDESWKNFEKSSSSKSKIPSPNENFDLQNQTLNSLILDEYKSLYESKDADRFNFLFFNKKLIQKILILVGGVTFNIIGAFVIFLVALNVTGLMYPNSFEKTAIIDFPSLVKDKQLLDDKGNNLNPEYRKIAILKSKNVNEVLPAAKANIPAGAELLDISIPNQTFKASELTNEKIQKLVNDNPEQDFVISYKDGTEIKNIVLKPQKIEKNNTLGLAITNNGFYKSKNFVNSIKDAYDHTIYYTVLTADKTVEFFVNLFSPRFQESIKQAGSPIMISKVTNDYFNAFGFASVLWLMALISISLAVFNILPIPALDGGRIVLAILERIFGSPIKKVEPILISSTYLALLAFMFVVLGKDIFSLFWK
ncbi:MAG: site-2 protease family protein [Patescibacteria group bacterium]